MHSIHLPNVHLPADLFAMSVGAISWFSIALFFFLLSWAVGGDEFKASIGGNVSLAVLVGGIVVSAIFAAVSRPEK